MDIVLTWPQKVPYAEYVSELNRAVAESKVIYFKVSALPKKASVGDRCYMVHSGYVRGWSQIVGFNDGTVVPDAVRDSDSWTLGKYIVRSPIWHELQYLPRQQGFQGFRYADPSWRDLLYLK